MSRKRKILGELTRLLKFTGIGSVNVLLDVTIYSICVQFLKLPTYQSQLLSVIFGLFCSYILNRKYTFCSKQPILGTELFKFALLSMICTPASSIGIHYLDDYFNLGPWISKGIVTVVIGLVNYTVSRTLVFRSLRQRKAVRFLSQKIYEFNRKIIDSRLLQTVLVAFVSISVDVCMYVYLAYVGLDSFKSQPLCVVAGLVCCYLISLKFLVYRVEHAVGFFCVSVLSVMACSPIMYLFSVRLGLHTLLAKIPATVCTAAIVFVLCRWIVYRDIFEENSK